VLVVSRVFGRLLRTGLAGSTRGTCCALPSLGTVLAASAVVDPASPVHSRPSAASSSPAASLTAVLFATPSRAVGLRPRSARHASEHAPGTSGKWASPDSRLGSCHGVLRVRTILMNVGLVSDLVSTRLSKNTDCDHEKRERTAACYRRCRARSAPPRSAQSTATTPKPGMSFVFVAASDGSSPGCVSDRNTSAYPRLPVSDECSDDQSEPRSEQAGVEWTQRAQSAARALVWMSHRHAFDVRPSSFDYDASGERPSPNHKGQWWRASAHGDDSAGDGACLTGPQDTHVNEAHTVVRQWSRRQGTSLETAACGPRTTVRGRSVSGQPSPKGAGRKHALGATCHRPRGRMRLETSKGHAAPTSGVRIPRPSGRGGGQSRFAVAIRLSVLGLL
jgi:hypothetical protein